MVDSAPARRYSIALAAAMAVTTMSGQSSPDYTRVEETARQELAETRAPGMAIAIVHGEAVAFAKGLGRASIESEAAVTPDTLFQIGSVSKMFTAAALVSLASEGRLALSDPIGRVAAGLHPAIAALTAHQLLSQTSGLRDQPADFGRHDEAALGEAVRSWSRSDLLLAPGRVFSYSNIGYATAGHVLEAVDGRPFADAMRDRLFTPLGMTRTTFRPLEAMTYPLALGHRTDGGSPTVVRPLADDTRFWPAGYMYSSAVDLARFATAFLNGGRLDGRQALPPAVIAALGGSHAAMPNLFDGGSYGYGLMSFEVRGLQVVEHAGSMPGYSAVLRMVPARRVGVIVLANADGLMPRRTMTAAMEAVLPLTPEPEQRPRNSQAVAPGELRAFVGSYRNRWTFDLFKQDGQLMLRRGEDAPLAVSRIGARRFLAASPGAPRGLEFVLEPGLQGQPAYLHFALWAFVKQ